MPIPMPGLRPSAEHISPVWALRMASRHGRSLSSTCSKNSQDVVHAMNRRLKIPEMTSVGVKRRNPRNILE